MVLISTMSDRLRAGSTGRVLPHVVMAPSTVGTFLRSFTWGHVRQLEKVLTIDAGAGLASGSRSSQVGGDAGFGLDDLRSVGQDQAGRRLWVHQEHPLFAFRADTGEVVGARLRAGSSQRGVVHFATETIRRVRRAGARGRISLRADAGFWSYAILAALNKAGVGWSITTRLNSRVRAQISKIEEDTWTPIGYTRGAQVAETELEMINPRKRGERLTVRLVVRRTRLVGHQAALARLAIPRVRHQPDLPPVEADHHHQPHAGQDNAGRCPDPDTRSAQATIASDSYHRSHATCELAIRDLKEAAGLAHLPSASFNANAAWLLCAALAHNLHRHIAHLGRTQPPGRLVRGRTIRTRLFGLPGRLVNHGGKLLLRLPARWPWADTYLTTLTNLRSLPQLC